MKSCSLEYNKPKKELLEALLVGSGRMGAMFFQTPVATEWI